MVMSHQVSDGNVREAPSRNGTDEFTNRVNQLLGELRVELDALQRESTEIDMLVRQSSQEVEKLANREMAATNRVRDMELNLDNYSRTDMKTIYNSAHEIQMRLFMMRAQVEQLETKRNNMKNLQQRLQRVSSVLLMVPQGYNPNANPTSRHMQHTQADPTPAPAQQDGNTVTNKHMISQVIQAQESERLRVSRQIHDGPAQTMTNLVLRAEICERLIDMDVARAKTELVGLKTVVNSTLQDTRRFIFDLRPMILDDLGLEPTLRRYIQQFTDKYKLDVGIVINGINGRLPNEIEVAIFRIVQEALTNVAQHAHAKHAQVTIEANGDVVKVTIEDDGAGFNMDSPKLNDPKLNGLSTMRQRVEMIGGEIAIESTPGRGTRIVTTLPAEASE